MRIDILEKKPAPTINTEELNAKIDALEKESTRCKGHTEEIKSKIDALEKDSLRNKENNENIRSKIDALEKASTNTSA